MPADKEKKTKRSQAKYPALTPKLNSRVKQEKIDFDYLDQLSPSELEWLNKFMEEEMNARFKNDGTDFNQTKEERKKVYDRNNQANRDQYGLVKGRAASKLVEYGSNIEDELSRGVNPSSMENAYLDFIETQELKVILKEYDEAMKAFITDLLLP